MNFAPLRTSLRRPLILLFCAFLWPPALLGCAGPAATTAETSESAAPSQSSAVVEIEPGLRHDSIAMEAQSWADFRFHVPPDATYVVVRVGGGDSLIGMFVNDEDELARDPTSIAGTGTGSGGSGVAQTGPHADPKEGVWHIGIWAHEDEAALWVEVEIGTE